MHTSLRSRWPLGVLLLLVLVHVARAGTHLDTWVDDAWISARYAAHVAAGHGPTYNVGLPPVEGYTDPLWVGMIAAGLAAGFPLFTWGVALGLMHGALGLVAVYALTRALRPDAHPAIALVGPALLAVDLHWAVVATNGLESAQFAAFTALACAAAVSGWGSALVALGPALVLCRPEGLAVAVGAVAWSFLRAPRRSATLAAITTGTTAAVLFGHRWVTFGAWLPNTVDAKSHKTLLAQLTFNLNYLGPDAPWWIALAVVAALATVAHARARRTDAGFVLAGALGLLAIVAQVDWWMPGARLLQGPLLLVIAAAAAALPAGRVANGFALAIGAALLGLATIGLVPKHVERYDRVHSAVPGNGAERAGIWLRAHLPPGSTLVTRDAGVLAYHWGVGNRMYEAHPRALTRRHVDRADATLDDLPRDAEVFAATVARESTKGWYYADDREAFRKLRGGYVYLGRVEQHFHRYYDIWVRDDLDVPPLPPEIVVNRIGTIGADRRPPLPADPAP